MVKKISSKNSSFGTKEIIGIGAGVAALGAAAFILFGPEGKQNRKAIKGWSVKMKGEIIEKFEEAKELTEPIYHKIIDDAQAKYAKVKKIDQEELNKVVSDMKKHWKTIKKEAVNKKPNKKTSKK